MSRSVIFLNGPARAGKDTAARIICRTIRGAHHAKFAQALKERTHALYGFPQATADAFEAGKDRPSDAFLGLTPRQAYIAVSEKLMKPMHGPEVFGQILLLDLSMRARDASVIVVSDSGFACEAEPLLRAFGADGSLLIRLHRDGCGFDGDSRSYWQREGLREADVTNNGSERDLSSVLSFTLKHYGLLKD